MSPFIEVKLHCNGLGATGKHSSLYELTPGKVVELSIVDPGNNIKLSSNPIRPLFVDY